MDVLEAVIMTGEVMCSVLIKDWLKPLVEGGGVTMGASGEDWVVTNNEEKVSSGGLDLSLDPGLLLRIKLKWIRELKWDHLVWVLLLIVKRKLVQSDGIDEEEINSDTVLGSEGLLVVEGRHVPSLGDVGVLNLGGD